MKKWKRDEKMEESTNKNLYIAKAKSILNLTKM